MYLFCLTKTLACIASVSARVSRESWDESKKKKKERQGSIVFFFCSRSKFRTITLRTFTDYPPRNVNRAARLLFSVHLDKENKE